MHIKIMKTGIQNNQFTNVHTTLQQGGYLSMHKQDICEPI